MMTALTFDDNHLTEPICRDLLERAYLPEAVRSFPPWFKAAARATWMRSNLDFSLSRDFKRRAMR